MLFEFQCILNITIMSKKHKINKMRRIICSTFQPYDEWKEMMEKDNYGEEMAEMNGGSPEDYLSYEAYQDSISNWFADERANLSYAKCDGIIIAFADLGLWDGRHVGVSKRTYGNIKDILRSNADDVEFYCDPWNVKCEERHHDGRNYLTFRSVNSYAAHERLLRAAEDGTLTYEAFLRATKSIRKPVAKVYGW